MENKKVDLYKADLIKANILVIMTSKKMKLFIYIGIFLGFVSCKNEKDKYLKKYPFFKNVEIYDKTKTVSLNNFTSHNNENGLEYLLNENGSLLEVRNWKNNTLNGYSYLYSPNGKINVIAHFVNDTMSGNYFELDTLTGNIEFWSDKVVDEGIVVDENYIRFRNGIIDLTSSSFYQLKKLNDSVVVIGLPCKYPFPFTKVTVEETNNKEYKFSDNETEIKSKDNVHYYYKIKNRKTKYIVGKASYYRLSKGENDEGITGRDIYFNIEINQ